MYFFLQFSLQRQERNERNLIVNWILVGFYGCAHWDLFFKARAWVLHSNSKVLKILIQRGGAVETEVEWEQRSDREGIVIKQLKLKLRRVRPEGRKTGSGEIVRLNCLSLELVLLTILADKNGIEASNRDELNSFSTGFLFSKKLT